MTGYGSAVRSSKSYKVSAEIKSLNHKYLDLSFKLPRSYMKYETELRNHLAKKLKRGKVVVFLDVEILSIEKQTLNINRPLLNSYLETLNSLKTELKVEGEISLPFLFSLPEVLPSEPQNPDPEEWELIKGATMEACVKLIGSRKEEGSALFADMQERCRNIATHLVEVERLAPLRIDAARKRLENALEEVKTKFESDPNRFEQELIYYLERLDINEEIVRLKQHLKYFDKSLKTKDSNGKKLNFISQEMGREINTIGSKANLVEMQQFVIQMKDELEKVKEQIQNIL